MNVLAFDCCFGAISVAVRHRASDGEWLLECAYETRATGHAERLMPLIAETMARAGLDFGALDRIAVTVGPGSFTGVRVGIAAARALALATGKPVVGMSSLAVMAEECRSHLGDACKGVLLVVAVDARRGMIYAQLSDEGASAATPLLLTPEQVAALVGRRSVLVAGSGAQAVAGCIAAAGGKGEVALPDLQPHARVLAQRAPDLVPISPVQPLYLRRPDVKMPSEASLPRAAS